MLQPVSGTSRCICPGLSRMIAVFRWDKIMNFVSDLRAVTAFFATARQISLERILASLEIVGTETPLGLKQWLVRLCSDSLSRSFCTGARLHRGVCLLVRNLI